MNMENLKSAIDAPADVCLVLEGTYPYIHGGVSSWVHQLIQSLPHLTFNCVTIMPSAAHKWDIKYELPSNLLGLSTLFLHDYQLNAEKPLTGRTRKAVKNMEKIHDIFHDPSPDLIQQIITNFIPKKRRQLSMHDMINSKPAWDMVLKKYMAGSQEESFLDFFWTFRITHLPLFHVLNFPLVKAKVYHSVSTGYAGFLASILATWSGRPLLLTEHGIYTKERKMEIIQSEWIFLANRDDLKIQRDLGFFQRWWIRIFEALSKMTYQTADVVVTLYEGNRQMQIADGCPPEKTRIIPNGIMMDELTNLRPEPQEGREFFNVALVGRVVPIKDIKTFIRACKIVSLYQKNARFQVLGSITEDKRYFQECKTLVETLQLSSVFSFTGNVDMRDHYPNIDLVCLTSQSEAQPLVILEANFLGIPVVATNVGACQEMLQGNSPEDRALGSSGIITPVNDPWSTAQAIMKLMKDDRLKNRMIQSGYKRVSSYYSHDGFLQKYSELYQTLMAKKSISREMV